VGDVLGWWEAAAAPCALPFCLFSVSECDGASETIGRSKRLQLSHRWKRCGAAACGPVEVSMDSEGMTTRTEGRGVATADEEAQGVRAVQDV
jgi:hypothetical protein